MARKTVALLPSTERALEKVGANIKRARLRGNIRAKLLAERAGISVDILSSIEKGVSTGSCSQHIESLNKCRIVLKVFAFRNIIIL